MGEVRFMISEAAKQVKVEAHVLRYWEEELDLTIGRTEMGHRYYTKDDIQLFRCIKKLKDEGMLLKDLKPLIPELKATRLKLQAPQTPDESPAQKEAASAQTLSSTAGSTADNSPRSAAKEKGKAVHENKKAALQPVTGASVSQVPASESHAEPAEVIPVTQLEQVRSLIGDVLTEVVTDNNEILKKDISRTVTADVMREMDFLFQAKERQEEEHFRKLDCLIRQQQANRRETVKGNPIMKLKKMFT
jgi:DNA-binding transcriptional MerR regulator